MNFTQYLLQTTSCGRAVFRLTVLFFSLNVALQALGPARITLADESSRKPNIVYIMADELGYFELSCVGNPNLKTPNLDRMAAEGMRFTQAMAGSSVCAPTRCTLMTGKHSGHTSVRVNGGGTPLRADEITIATILKQQGYATGGFGKWGCGGRGSTGVPEKHGFDLFLGYYDQVHAHSYYPPYIVRNSEEVPLKGNHGGEQGETYSHYVIIDAAKQFIREHKDEPFFCYMPITPPHGLFNIPDDDPAWAIYKDEPWSEQARRYAAMVSMVDRQVGDVLALLKELQIEENTLVFFCGDNGGNDYFTDDKHHRGIHGANLNPLTKDEFRGRKGMLYEGGLRIPMIARWPGKIAPGKVSDLLWYFPDVMPTVAELTGAATPDDIDGVSIVPELLGEDTVGRKQTEHKYLYWEIGQQTAVRMGNWKAIRPKSNASWELYDLGKDISESMNIADSHPEVLQQLVDYAAEAHEPAVEGTFHDPAIHERDRQAKFGKFGSTPPNNTKRKKTLPQTGLIPFGEMKVHRVSSESKSNGKLARYAIDGDLGTWWHSNFAGEADRHPHELVIDLGGEHEVRGIRYMARQDGGWNGAIGDCEVLVSKTPDGFVDAAASISFRKSRDPQDATFEPVTARYVMIRILSEVNGGPWASIAELGIIGQ
ncbi:MAG: sulfatase-like hydrolase/transferase [Planctomycetaceae bacterium]|nr:sulfatase-like hydrolase/transferase [Planctomycetales bacterium]MCB9925882.1 sulfatase-like hydrolase/transferase [Planctomycetaceae bacterium]